jgi:LysR family transcriptional regulator, low CO2-responsive transcriptional regulator
MNYTLHQLQVFLKVAQTKSITRAAEELFLTQPAVSIQLKNFQDQFEIPLAQVVGRKIHITDFGREIAEAAEKIVEEVHAIHYKTLIHKGLLSGKLKISAVSTGKYVMPYFLSGFMQKHSGIDFTIDVTNKSKVLKSLEQNNTDFALVSILPEAIPVEKIELMPNKLFWVGRSMKKGVSAEMSNSLIYREEGSGTRVMMEKYLEKHKIKSPKKLELTSNEAVKQAVMAGLGYSIMPLIGIKNELKEKQLVLIPKAGLPMQTCWYLIWLKNKKLSPAAEAYKRYVVEEKQKIIEQSFGWINKY